MEAAWRRQGGSYRHHDAFSASSPSSFSSSPPHPQAASAATKKASTPQAVEWVALQKHPVFSGPRCTPTESSGRSGNLAAWDASSSRLYLWDPEARCLHRLSLRFRDPQPDSSSSVFAEAAVPSELLLPDIQIQFVVNYISLNIDGSSLLFVGSGSLSLMYLFERTYKNDNTFTCRTVSVASQILFGHNNGLQTLRVSWHPYSSSHLGILSSDSVFRLFDLSSDLERPEQEYYLQPFEPGRCHNAASICPVAFSYGGQHLWDRFSIFVLYSDGSVYALCPVVPFGSLCSRAYVEEIYEDMNEFGLKSSDLKVVSNSRLAIDWLEATFPDLADQSFEEGSVLASRAHPYAPIDASLSLQGPLGKICPGEENHDFQSSAGCDGRAVDLLYCSIDKDSVLVTAWSSGQLQIDALADEVQPHWNNGSPPHLNVDSSGHIKSIAMICELNMREVSTLKSSQSLDLVSNISSTADMIWVGCPPPLLRLAIVDLALPKNALNNCQLSLFSDPLVSEKFCCLHGGGIDLVTLHFLPFTNLSSAPDKIAKAPSVHPILSTGINASFSPVLSGFVSIADPYGHSLIIGITSSYECILLGMKGWNELPPHLYDMDTKSVDDTENAIPEIISKELLDGPKVILVPPSTTLQSLTADSIEGRSTLHHYIKLFHENYVEYAHKVYIELKEHAGYLKTIIEDQHKHLHETKQLLLNVEAKEQGIKNRTDRAFKVYELLEQRLQNFKKLPGASKKPLSRAEREFKAELERFADLELDALHSSIESLNARLKRYSQSSPVSSRNASRQTPVRGKSHVSDAQTLQLKSSLQKLSSLNIDNAKKVKLIENELKNQEK
ncbi:nuclear pore complex protein NUP88 [Phoenix dactylifera]|uniref:Nuclear pore complex protein NUP88 n=1 Tax=Phoenix dactylifera TaxID=42345 RepID=A0A8B7BXS9_PHODC|nr:nuclear pore complex protein NUP88 [Phoenix dactylifera]